MHSLTTSHESGLQQPGTDILTPLATRSLFWRARYLEPSPVMCHIPLLFWLTEAAHPRVAVTLGVADSVPHFALCQAVDKLGLDSFCMGFEPAPDQDTKAADLTQQIAFNEANFADFSQIVQDGANHESLLSPESKIDLLIVNRSLTQNLADALDKNWLPHLSERSVIVFLQGGKMPGYSSYLRHLASAGNMFTCDLDTRATVIFYGPEQNDRLQRLANLQGGQSGYLAARSVFARLGELHSNTAKLALKNREASIARRQRDEKTSELENAQAEVGKLRTEFEKLEAQYNERSAMVATAQAEAFDLNQTVKNLEKNLQDSLSNHEQERKQLRREHDLLKESLLKQEQENKQLRREHDLLKESLNSAEAERLELQKRATEQKDSLLKQEQENRQLRKEYDLLKQSLSSLEVARLELQKKATEQQDSLSERYHDIAILGLELQAKTDETEKLAKEQAAFKQEIEDLKHTLTETERVRDLHMERIRALETSSSWRVTAPLRKASLAIKPR
ncbi:MAG: hypothetical protein ABF308_18955 [Phaeobacter gallaeciensis]